YKFITQHGKAICKKSLFHFHKDLAITGKQVIDVFCFLRRIKSKGKIGATHGFGIRNVSAPDYSTTYLDYCMKNWFLPFFRKIGRRCLVRHHHIYFSTKMLLVKPECFFAMSRVVNV